MSGQSNFTARSSVVCIMWEVARAAKCCFLPGKWTFVYVCVLALREIYKFYIGFGEARANRVNYKGEGHARLADGTRGIFLGENGRASVLGELSRSFPRNKLALPLVATSILHTHVKIVPRRALNCR